MQVNVICAILYCLRSALLYKYNTQILQIIKLTNILQELEERNNNRNRGKTNLKMTIKQLNKIINKMAHGAVVKKLPTKYNFT